MISKEDSQLVRREQHFKEFDRATDQTVRRCSSGRIVVLPDATPTLPHALGRDTSGEGRRGWLGHALVGLPLFFTAVVALSAALRVALLGPAVIALAAPFGFSVGVIAVMPARWRPAYVVTMVAGNLVGGAALGLVVFAPGPSPLSFGAANAVAVTVFLLLLGKFAELATRGQLGWFLLATTAAATVNGVVVAAFGQGLPDPEIGVARFGAVFLGIITLAPVSMLRRRLLELGGRDFLLLAGAMAVTLGVVFGPTSDPPVFVYGYLPLALVLFGAVRYGTPGAAVLLLTLTVTAIVATHFGRGPWGQVAEPFEQVLAVHVYVLTAAAGAWSIAIMLAERTLAEARSAEERLERVVTARTAELREIALHDPLTGLANRHLFAEQLDRALAPLDGSGRVALLALDLDGFKRINDELGHHAGDTVLRAVAERLASEGRSNDTVARIDSDEFMLLLVDPGSDDDIRHRAEGLKAAVGTPLTVDDRPIEMDVSIGITVTDDARLATKVLLRRTDHALFEAKRRGPGHIQFDPVTVSAMPRHGVEAESMLRESLQRNWLTVHYQPIVDLMTARAVSLEALVRIQHPTHGLVMPEAFIDLAESSDLIAPLEEQVLALACRQMAQWRQAWDISLSVNVSGRQLARLGLYRRVLEAVRSAGIDPEVLTLEITERQLVTSTEIRSNLFELSGQGIRIAIDDFGTGHSSLAYLQQLPVDTIKIDRSFVADIHTQPRNSAIVTAVAGLGQALGHTVVAEGVEVAAQRDELLRLGCTLGQGYYYAHPMDVPEIEKYLRARLSRSTGAGVAASGPAKVTPAPRFTIATGR